MKLIGVDVGGTFTDLVYTDTDRGETVIHKTPTTPDDPSRGVVEGAVELCRRVGVDPASIDHLMHGTTIATNAVLEYDGVEAGLITTEGYRDILHIGRHQRPQHYSIMQEIPWQDRPLVKRRHRKTVTERLAPPRGEVLMPLDEDAVRRAARELREAGVKAIAIGFLFSYLNPAHEERAREIVIEEHPDAFVTTSALVAPQFREFERFTTAAMNAFIGPKVRDYVSHLESAMRDSGLGCDLHVMGSNGGAATAKMVAEKPILTLLSGPAAGVLGGAWSGALSGHESLITLDIGGTSADIGITVDGAFAEATARDTWIGGYPVLAPMIDIHTIGAGGGSIAHVDAGGAMRVGPRSAGARPGPAAYGHGGDQPTVTDAHVVLGRLDPKNFLGGEMSLDVDASRKVISGFADKVGLGVHETAAGILTIVNANMANAIRSRTVQKGLDPRDFALVAFGGAGPLHAADVADLLDIPTVLVPAWPGITSAVGLLTTDLKYDAVKTEFQVSTDIDLTRLNADFAAMEADLGAQLAADKVDPASVGYKRAGDLRYVGQGYELRVAFPGGVVTESVVKQVLAAFAAAHEAEYGHAFPGSPVEIVNIRVTANGEAAKIAPPSFPGGDSVEAATVHQGEAVFATPEGVTPLPTAFLDRFKLPLDTDVRGPAVILQTDTTTVVPPGWTARADAAGNLLLTKGDA
ncbi:hydantoinase/oxoprolinase family protein [Thalassobaculum litoreum]|uniref:N-methylhydantoinase A n=1 Tax=Thalassobaculum litoreum DSM 18839 TaxID=1123362 RepID=A0A8G2BJP6_9PROT|nr:hydantoinase/oxoprolinase family protein [Thalassobaculum litoreum]SDF65842.1 N-methylhydantoinase A [Thalassobaculum litoreum DSM 18839]